MNKQLEKQYKLLNLSKQYSTEGKIKSAIDYLRKIDAEEFRDEVNLLLGINYKQMHVYDLALIALDLIDDTSAYYSEAILEKAIIYRQKKLFHESFNELKSLELKKRNEQISIHKAISLTLIGEENEALEILNKILRKDPDNISALYESVKVLIKQEKNLEARRYLNKILTINKAHYSSRIMLALIEEKENNNSESFRQLDYCIEMSPSSEEAYYHKARLLNKTGKQNEAKNIIEKNLEIGNDEKYTILMAEIYRNNNELDEWIYCLKKGLERFKSAGILLYLVRSLFEKCQITQNTLENETDVNELISIIKNGFNNIPLDQLQRYELIRISIETKHIFTDNDFTWEVLSISHDRKLFSTKLFRMLSASIADYSGNQDKAINILNTILIEDPLYFPAAQRLAIIYLRNDNAKYSKKVLKKYLDHKRDSAAFLLLGQIYHSELKYMDAHYWYKLSIRYDPQNYDAHYYMLLLYQDLAKTESVNEHYYKYDLSNDERINSFVHIANKNRKHTDEQFDTDLLHNLPIFYINLDHDKGRKKRIKSRLDELGLNGIRIRGIDTTINPHKYKQRKLVQGMDIGGVGCFLSHVKIWQLIMTLGLQNSIVLEDDSWPISEMVKYITPNQLPQEYDIVFVNESMGMPNEDLYNTFQIINIDDVAIERSLVFPNQLNVGTYGYIISYDGANKLFNIYNQEGIIDHIDWIMLAHSIGDDFYKKANKKSNRYKHLRRIKKDISDMKISSYVSDPPLIAHRSWHQYRKLRV